MVTPAAAAVTTLLLVRHGDTDALGVRLSGRSPGVHLNAHGQAQAGRLPARLRGHAIAAVYAGPLERALETARPLADAHGLHVQEDAALTEVDFGEWTGRTFDELAAVPEWTWFNTHRSRAPVPDGETPLQVQARIVRALDALAARHRGDTIAVVSHADVIRAAVMLYAGAPLDFIHRFTIDPASITTILIGDAGPTLLSVNERDTG